MEIVIRENVEKHMKELKEWLADTAEEDLEEMSRFFSSRISGYEEHMSMWDRAYCRFTELFPTECETLLDLGCGTGLELDGIWKKNPDLAVTGIDMCQTMLDKLAEKHRDKKLKTLCGDYFQMDFGQNEWDAVVSFESFHHFIPDEKQKLYEKIFACLKPGGIFLLGDYLACCDEEEELLQKVYADKRKKYHGAMQDFVHFDIPLTVPHELELLRRAGFREVEKAESIDGVTILVLKKE